MKTIKLPLCFLLCAVALVVIIGCPGILGMLGDTTFKLIIENKTNTNLYVEFINTYVWNSCGVNANRTVVLAHDYEDHKPIDDLTLRGSIEFYYLIGDDNWPRPGKFIKQIADINSVITVTADNRDQYDLGEVIYKLVITDAMLGIGGAQVGGSDEESDENTSETEAENTGEINTDENDGDNNENENN